MTPERLAEIEARFGANVRARREHDPAVRDVLALTAEVRRLMAGRELEQHGLRNAVRLLDRYQVTVSRALALANDPDACPIPDGPQDECGRAGWRFAMEHIRATLTIEEPT
jgi:hypothetical protein